MNRALGKSESAIVIPNFGTLSKNFSFAPAYDLTGGVPPEAPPGDSRRQWENCHALSVNGKQSDITDDDLLAVADRYAIGTAPKILAHIKEVFGI